jgi:hypothetical protein
MIESRSDYSGRGFNTYLNLATHFSYAATLPFPSFLVASNTDIDVRMYAL